MKIKRKQDSEQQKDDAAIERHLYGPIAGYKFFRKLQF